MAASTAAILIASCLAAVSKAACLVAAYAATFLTTSSFAAISAVVVLAECSDDASDEGELVCPPLFVSSDFFTGW